MGHHGNGATGQTAVQMSSRGFSSQSAQRSGRVSQISLKNDFSIRSEPPRAVIAVNKGRTSGDEQRLRQERCSQPGLHRSWQCN